MKKITRFRSYLLSAAFTFGALTFTSCDDNNENGPAGEYARNGVLISNEGAMTKSNASVSFFSHGSKTVENESFKKVNAPLVLGDVLQHMTQQGDKLYLVMNNSGKVVVANAHTLKAESEIAGLEAPRYFAALNDDKAYVTEWLGYDANYVYSNGRVAVVDLKTNTVTKTITVGVQPEQLLITGGKLYVANSGGNTVTVINTATDAIETTITVNDGPSSLALDRNKVLWVSSQGVKVYDPTDWSVSEENSTPGSLAKINTSSNMVMATLTFSQHAPAPGKLTPNLNGDKLYYVFNNKVWVQDVNATTLATKPLIDRGTYVAYGFNGLGIEPASGTIYAGKATDYASNGWVVRYNPQSGAAVDSFRVGIAPNGFLFR